MPLTDQSRIALERDRPRIVDLWQALTALRSTVSFMNTGAHPDDETSTMLAAMRFRDGVDISYTCSTRGEGGQNDIGTESEAALGTLRTAEMEAACDRLDLRMYWLGFAPDDPISDFGFSKSGAETLRKWGRSQLIARFVDVIRTERPDIICPTFLDVPGQHGHHRAMTQAALEMMALAADPAFTSSSLPVWQIKKTYLPAWSGAGQAYDDDLPPPEATSLFDASGQDPVTGWGYAHIGEQSRAMHATQTMGRWVPLGATAEYPLHLAQSFGAKADDGLTSGLAATLRDFGIPILSEAQDACDAALEAFPDADAVLHHACAALKVLRHASEGLSPAQRVEFGHKLTRKDQQLSRVIHLAAGVSVRVALQKDVLHPGDQTALEIESMTRRGKLTLKPLLPQGWTSSGSQVELSPDVAISDPYPPVYLPHLPKGPCVEAALTVHALAVRAAVPFEVPPLVLPQRSANLSPSADIINLSQSRRSVELQISEMSPHNAVPDLELPDGWASARYATQLIATAPTTPTPGLYDISLTLDEHCAHNVQLIRCPHIAQRALAQPAVARVRVVDVALPDVKVGYIGGGNDRVDHWLSRLGVDVTDLSDTDLTDAVLNACDSIVIGIFAMKFRAGLAEAMPRIKTWVEAGGTLLTLYHRPWDNWDADTTAPYRLEIGQPSLRWRVTDETAEVTLLAPDHPLMTTPNRIDATDWADWKKERGLYFAKDWDAACVPLLAMNDPGEAPLHGALLAADVGHGRHVHTSLILHHQMEKLTPGAFRLMANLIAKRS